MAAESPVLESYESLLREGLLLLKNNFQMLREESLHSSEGSGVAEVSAELEVKRREMRALLCQSCRLTEMRFMSKSVKDLIDTKGLELAAATAEYIAKHPVDFRASPLYHLVKSVMENEEDDPVLRCPITGALLEDPVRSTRCSGHRFSRVAIQELLSRSSSIQCPVSGCHNFLSSGDIVEDEAVALRLYRIQHRGDPPSIASASSAESVRTGMEEEEEREREHRPVV